MAEILNDEEVAEELVSKLLEKQQQSIVVYNDDINTFEHVIYCLIKYCNHGREQAEQCAMIIHNKGKYAVKSGTSEKLIPIYAALTANKLTANIE
jgi:ATP-dependent Clp protease adaptor protein ClpS